MDFRNTTGSGHIRGAGGFYLFYWFEPLLFKYFIEISNNFVKKPQAFNPFVVSFKLSVEFGKIGNRCK